MMPALTKARGLMAKRVVVCAGGTGGHLFPAIALAEQLQSRDPELEIMFIGGKLGTTPWFARDRFCFREIPCATLSSYHPVSLVRTGLEIGRGVRQGLRHIREFKPDVAVSFGSFYAFPAAVAARLAKVPLILQASDALPGKAIRLLSPFAHVTACQFPEAVSYLYGEKAVVGMPLKHERKVSPAEARSHYGLGIQQPTLLVFGGSQGAEAINQLMIGAAQHLPKELQIIHLTGGTERVEQVLQAYRSRGLRAHVKPFETAMHLAWCAADLAVCRSGAATISEMKHFECPALLVPYPHAADQHQDYNADALGRVGAALKLSQDTLTPEALAGEILRFLFRSPEEMQTMQLAMQAAHRQRPTETLSDLIMLTIEGVLKV